MCFYYSYGIVKSKSREKSINRKKSDKNRIKSDKKSDKIGKSEKIGKIGFDLNSDSTALVFIGPKSDHNLASSITQSLMLFILD